MPRTAHEKREWMQDIVAHLLATITVVGFFTVIFFSLSGRVDLTNQTVSLFVGTAMGYAAAQAERVMARYFKTEVKQALAQQDSLKGKDDV